MDDERLAEMMMDFGNFNLASQLFMRAVRSALSIEEGDRLLRQANRALFMALAWGQ